MPGACKPPQSESRCRCSSFSETQGFPNRSDAIASHLSNQVAGAISSTIHKCERGQALAYGTQRPPTMSNVPGETMHITNPPIMLVEDDAVDAMTVRRALRTINVTNPLVLAE